MDDDGTCLQQRCIDVLHNQKSIFREGCDSFTPKHILEALRKLKPAIMESLLLLTMEDTYSDLRHKEKSDEDSSTYHYDESESESDHFIL